MRRTAAVVGALGLLSCSQTPDERCETIEGIIQEQLEARTEANERILGLLQEQAQVKEDASEESGLEQEIQERFDFDIIGGPDEKTEEALQKIQERFALYEQLFGENTTLKRIYLIENRPDLGFILDRTGNMQSNGVMSLYSVSDTLLDHEYTHSRQTEGMEERHTRLRELIESSGDSFSNEDYDPSTKSWLDGSGAKGYFFTAYSNANEKEYEAELFEEISLLLRGESSAFKHVDRDLPLWGDIFRLNEGPILPTEYVLLMEAYMNNDAFKDAIDDLYSSFENKELIMKTVSHPDELIWAAQIIRDDATFALRLLESMTTDNLLERIMDKCIEDPEYVLQETLMQIEREDRRINSEQREELLERAQLNETGYPEKINRYVRKYAFACVRLYAGPLIPDINTHSKFSAPEPALRFHYVKLFTMHSTIARLLEYTTTQGLNGTEYDSAIHLWDAHNTTDILLQNKLTTIEENVKEKGKQMLNDYLRMLEDEISTDTNQESRNCTALAYYYLTQARALPDIFQRLSSQNYDTERERIETIITASQTTLREFPEGWQRPLVRAVTEHNYPLYHDLIMQLYNDGIVERNENVIAVIRARNAFDGEEYRQARAYALRAESLNPELRTEDTLQLLEDLELVVLPE